MMGQQWTPLPGAESEVKALQALFAAGGRENRSTVLLGAQASEANLLAHNTSGGLARYRYLHFAAHGHLSTAAPLLSALVLAQGANPPGVDGYVTAAEWLLYKLDSDLIVLSACQSGLGSRVHGEGVMGIPYALFVAGNRRTLLSLWPVSDDSTARFMARLYTKLHAGTRVDEALAAVKREFARGGRDSHPLHWAGFVLYGD
jgi:CHAT domain-containing protein